MAWRIHAQELKSNDVEVALEYAANGKRIDAVIVNRKGERLSTLLSIGPHGVYLWSGLEGVPEESVDVHGRLIQHKFMDDVGDCHEA